MEGLYLNDMSRIEITKNYLDLFLEITLCRRVKATVLLASTSEIYGDPEVHPQPETYWGHVNTIGPRSCYDEGKRVAESLMVAYNKQVGFFFENGKNWGKSSHAK